MMHQQESGVNLPLCLNYIMQLYFPQPLAPDLPQLPGLPIHLRNLFFGFPFNSTTKAYSSLAPASLCVSGFGFWFFVLFSFVFWFFLVGLWLWSDFVFLSWCFLFGYFLTLFLSEVGTPRAWLPYQLNHGVLSGRSHSG